MKKAVYYLITVWILLWGQVISNHYLGATPISPQWFLVAVLYFGLQYGPWVGESVGFFGGLLIDASTMGLLGLHAVLYALAGYTAGMLRRQLDASKPWTQAIFSWMATIVYFGLYLVLERFFSISERSFKWAYVTVPFVNAVLAPLIYKALELWARAWDMGPVER